MKAENVELSFLLCDCSCMYSKLFDSMKPDEADELLTILEKQIAKDYGKYLKVRIVQIANRVVECVDINPKGQIKVQKDKYKIIGEALKEFLK